MDEIKKLTPAAARLLLALAMGGPHANYDDVVREAGIQRYQTLVDARKRLYESGFLTEIDGKEVVVLRRP